MDIPAVAYPIGLVAGYIGWLFVREWIEDRKFRNRNDPLLFPFSEPVVIPGEDMKRTEMYRQGDVLLCRVEGTTKTKLHPRLPAKAGVILAYGEVTGHAHVLDSSKVKALVRSQSATWDAAAERFIQVLETTALKHLDLPAGGTPTGEHADITLEPGMYEVVRQREWDESMQTRWVND